ncbi:phosphate signaling complex protein PhoU [Arthrobacter cryoconiti]|uniref:Phosphate-specific transport system accessory protein PhoU n=1 Tax=Arthrobacter cryoconiti TaxID=748907 RepID=A0ABV8QZI5_9MICC|nr:phosphate signaling complex protein PhoU [Arthrobacter cryoconiti]MCC9067735.1 phosphate signaling complex protein PhoU [Arthrobacter cryoconiti]
MRKVFQAELHQIGEGLVEISALVGVAIEKSTAAFASVDLQGAEEVIAADARIDFLQNDLDERAIDVLALQGPVASDLRMIVGALRMSASLERMGDLARHISQLTRLRFPNPVVPQSLTDTFAELARLDILIAAKVAELLDSRDLELVTDILAAKGAINKIHKTVFSAMAAPDWAETAATTVDVTLASRYFERFGDHGVSVARKVSYLVTGEWQPEDFLAG